MRTKDHLVRRANHTGQQLANCTARNQSNRRSTSFDRLARICVNLARFLCARYNVARFNVARFNTVSDNTASYCDSSLNRCSVSERSYFDKTDDIRSNPTNITSHRRYRRGKRDSNNVATMTGTGLNINESADSTGSGSPRCVLLVWITEWCHGGRDANDVWTRHRWTVPMAIGVRPHTCQPAHQPMPHFAPHPAKRHGAKPHRAPRCHGMPPTSCLTAGDVGIMPS
jgi:hypothetical protein